MVAEYINEPDPAPSEIFALIIRYLDASPFHEVAQLLGRQAFQRGLLPSTTDFNGE